MGITEITRVENRVHVRGRVATVHEKIPSMVLAVIYSVGVLIGLWSFAALVGGLVTGGGPLGLVKGYFQAVTGL